MTGPNIRFFNQDYWSTAAAVIASSQAAALPAAATQDLQRTSAWRATKIEPNPWIKVDLGTPQWISAAGVADFVIISGPSGVPPGIPSGTLQLQVQWSDDNSSWTPVTVLPDPSPETRAATVAFTPAQHRYWRLYATGGPAGNYQIQVGTVFLGNYFEPTRNYRIPLDVPLVDPSQIVESLDGQRSVIRRTLYSTVTFKFEGIGLSDRNALMNLVRTVKGPIFIRYISDATYPWATFLAHVGPATYGHTIDVNTGGVPMFWVSIPTTEAR